MAGTHDPDIPGISRLAPLHMKIRNFMTVRYPFHSKWETHNFKLPVKSGISLYVFDYFEQ